MIRIRSSHMRALLVSVLFTAILVGLAAVAAAQDTAAAAEPAGVTYSILVFPFADETDSGRDLGAVTTAAFARALADAPGFEAESFHPNSPAARRRVDEGTLRTEDILPPYAAKSAVAIAAAVADDIVLMGTVVERTVDQETGVVSITVSGTTYRVRENVDPNTGQPVEELKPDKKFGVTGTSHGRHRGARRLRTLERSAADDAAAKAVQVLVGEKKTAPKKKKSFFKKWGYILIGAGVVAAIVASSNDGGGPGGADTPPPANLSWTIVNPGQPGQGVKLMWQPPPAPHATLLQYALRRSVNGGPFQALAASPVQPWQLEVTDWDVTSGQSIRYEIRAEYTNPTVASDWAPFGGAIEIPEIE